MVRVTPLPTVKVPKTWFTLPAAQVVFTGRFAAQRTSQFVIERNPLPVKE